MIFATRIWHGPYRKVGVVFIILLYVDCKLSPEDSKDTPSLEEYYIYRRTVTPPRINRKSVNPPVGPHCLLTTSRRTWVWLHLELGHLKSRPPNWLDYIFVTAVSPPTAVCFKSKLVSKRPRGNVFKSLWISALGAFVASRWISLVCPCLYSRDRLCFPVSWCLMSGAQLRYDHRSRKGNVNAASKPKRSNGYCRLSDHWLK